MVRVFKGEVRGALFLLYFDMHYNVQYFTEAYKN